MFDFQLTIILVLCWIVVETICKDEESSKEIDA